MAGFTLILIVFLQAASPLLGGKQSTVELAGVLLALLSPGPPETSSENFYPLSHVQDRSRDISMSSVQKKALHYL